MQFPTLGKSTSPFPSFAINSNNTPRQYENSNSVDSLQQRVSSTPTFPMSTPPSAQSNLSAFPAPFASASNSSMQPFKPISTSNSFPMSTPDRSQSADASTPGMTFSTPSNNNHNTGWANLSSPSFPLYTPQTDKNQLYDQSAKKSSFSNMNSFSQNQASQPPTPTSAKSQFPTVTSSHHPITNVFMPPNSLNRQSSSSSNRSSHSTHSSHPIALHEKFASTFVHKPAVEYLIKSQSSNQPTVDGVLNITSPAFSSASQPQSARRSTVSTFPSQVPNNNNMNNSNNQRVKDITNQWHSTCVQRQQKIQQIQNSINQHLEKINQFNANSSQFYDNLHQQIHEIMNVH